jgi:HEPN domain-containing protein
MNAVSADWVAKAEGDYEAPHELLALQRDSLNDSVCFHPQQCAEKYLKAFLVAHLIPFRRTHLFAELLPLCTSIDADLDALADHLTALQSYAVEIRYAGHASTAAMAQAAFAAASQVRTVIRAKLDL